MLDDRPLLRIGALSRTTGVAVSTLRSWEVRYGLPVPARSAGGHRLYPWLAVTQVQDVQALVAGGASTAAAAAAVLAAPLRGVRDSEPAVARDGAAELARVVPLEALLLRTRAAKAENHRLRAALSSATAAANASLGQLHSRAKELQQAESR